MWVGNAAGRWELLVEAYIKDWNHLKEFKEKIVKRFPKEIREISTTRVEKEFFLPRKRKVEIYSYTGQNRNVKKADDIDVIILDALAKDGRITYVDLSQKTGLTADAVVYRVKNLRERGYIIGYKTKIDESLLGYTRYKILIKKNPTSLVQEKKFLQFMLSEENTQYVLQTSGSWDYNITVQVKNAGEYKEYMQALKRDFGELIAGYELMILLDEYKDTYFDKRMIK